MNVFANRKIDHVVDRPLPEVVVDPEDGALRELREEDPVQLLRRGEVRPERLLDDDAGVLREARRPELLDHLSEENGRDGEVVRRALRAPQLLPDGGERRRVVVVAVHVAKKARQLREGRGVEAAVLLEALLRARPHLVEAPARLRDADDGDVQAPAFQHRLERREDLLVGEVARGPEEDERVRPCGNHRVVLTSPASRDARRTGSASPRGACSGSPPRRGRRSARRAPSSGRARGPPRRWRP